LIEAYTAGRLILLQNADECCMHCWFRLSGKPSSAVTVLKVKRYCFAEQGIRSYRMSLAYGITQYYVPSDTSEHTRTPARQAGTRFTYAGGMEGW